MRRLVSCAAGLIVGSGWTLPAIAQLQPDTTLGAETSVVNGGIVQGLPSQVIQGGAQRGVNLFHSFLNFNVAEGQRVYFGNPTGVANILTRVTGNTPSAILGTLGVDGGANLFLLNPNGIVFGANSRLDIRGSFLATTANRFTFPDGSDFSAAQPAAPPLLTINVTPGLQYGTNPGTVRNLGNLAVGTNLTLAGGDVITTGTVAAGGDLTLMAQNTVQIRDSTTAPFIAQAGGTLLIQGNQTVDIFALSHPLSGLISGGDMVLRSSTAVGGDARYRSGGNIRIEQLNGDLGDLFSPNDPIFYAVGDVLLNGYLGVSLHILAGGQVNIPGTVTISGVEPPVNGFAIIEAVPLQDGTTEQINGYTRPTLDIRAGTLAFTPPPGYAPGINTSPLPPFPLIPPPVPNPNTPATSADITIGRVDISAPNGSVFLTNHYVPNTNLPGGNITINGIAGVGIQTNLVPGNSGSVTVDSRNNITLNAPINTQSAIGIAGNVKLLAKNSILSNAIIDTHSDAGSSGAVTLVGLNNVTLNGQVDTYSTGINGGNVTVSSNGNIEINRSMITDVRVGSIGDAGDIRVAAPNVMIQNGAQLSANTFSAGSGGDIQVAAQQLTLQNNAQIASVTGDDLRINSAAQPNSGRGGNIAIAADSVNLLNQSFIIAQTNALSSGDAGDITIQANRLNLQDGSYISGVTFGTGQGADIQLQIANALTLTGTDTVNTQTGIFTNSFGIGNAGTLDILNTQIIALQQGALISANASGQGQAGDITINSPNAILNLTGISDRGTTTTASSILSATSGNGNAGDIRINTRQVNLQNGGQIDGQTIGTGNAGTLSVNATESIDVTGSTGNFQSRIFYDSSNAGQAGELAVSTPVLRIANGGQVSGRARNTGQGGFINIVAPTSVAIDGGQVSFDSTGTGNPRGITLTAGDVSIRNRGQLTVSSTESANAGNLTIRARELFMSDGARLTATTASGEGGNIEVQVDRTINLRRDSDIRTQALGTGNGGNIRLEAGLAILGVLSEDSDVIASAVTGRGGNIFATAPVIIGFRLFDRVETPESDFVASSELGIDGTLSVNDNNPRTLPALSDQFAQPGLVEGCVANTATSAAIANRGRFIESQRGGLPLNAIASLSSQALWQDDRPTAATPVATVPIASPEAIVEANSWVRLPDGSILLTVSATAPAIAAPVTAPTGCYSSLRPTQQ